MLTPLPSLSELAEDPGKAAGLPRERLCALLRDARRLAVEIEYLLTLAAEPGTPRMIDSGEPDRRLSAAEAAQFLGVTERWLRGHEIPGKIRLGRNVVYDARALAKYLRQRTTK
jgi:hypothetical protein